MIKTGLKHGFTLAEVLTTLMVIGVVAAMTIPTLLNSTDDQQHRVALKKAVSVLSQAIQLNVAKEEDGTIQSSAQLCAFFANSMAGSCSEAVKSAGNTDGIVTMTTADGMRYGFVFRGSGNGAAGGEEFTDFASICGNSALSNNTASSKKTATEGAWQGKNAKCIVLVDTNGGKGTPSFEAASDDNKLKKGKSGDAIPSDYTTKKDQFALIVNAAGVYPVITDSERTSASRAYKFLYGDSALTPWGKDFGSSNDNKVKGD